MRTLLQVAKWSFLFVAACYSAIILHTYYGVEELVEVNGEVWSMLEIREGLMFASLLGWVFCEVMDG